MLGLAVVVVAVVVVAVVVVVVVVAAAAAAAAAAATNAMVVDKRQILTVSTTGPCEACLYTVATGDTCQKIASRFRVTIAVILNLNPSIDIACTNLRIGQVKKADLCCSHRRLWFGLSFI